MSYSFNIRAASKAAALLSVAAELGKVVEQQPIHDFDREPTEAAVKAQLALVSEPAEGQEISVSVSGSLGWSKLDPVAGEFSNANVSIHVSVLSKT